MRHGRRLIVLHRREWKGLACALLLFAASAVLEAAVKLVVRPDGSKYVFNDSRGAGKTRFRPAPTPVEPTDVGPLISRYAGEQNLDEKLVRALIRIESDFDADAVSHKGAMGLMQLMPSTASELMVDNPYDAEENIRGGTAYLRRMLNVFDGRLEYALAAYNAGPEAVRKFGGIPPFPETRSYVEKVMRLYKDDASYSLGGSPHLRRGRRTYLFRDPTGRLRMSTSPPSSP